MIIGNGDIASVLTDRDDTIYFASGVSNSQETRDSEFRREKDKLFDLFDSGAHVNPNGSYKKLVYFGSLSVYYAASRYASHKLMMEQCVKMFPRWTIVRLGNITWGTNPHTLINFFKNQLARGEQVQIQDTYRYITDKDEFLYWISLVPMWSGEMNVPGRRMKVSEIYESVKSGLI